MASDAAGGYDAGGLPVSIGGALADDTPLRPSSSSGASPAPRAGRARVHRFSATERWLHWVHGGSFLLMLATGLVLFLPPLAGVIGNRPLVKGAHLVVAVAWLTGLALVTLLGDRRITRRTWRQFLSLRSDDLRWLTSQAARDEPQGRFNGGQKVHGLIQGALTVLFFVSGTLLYLGERNHSLRAPGSLALHDAAMLIGIAFVAGHIWIALRPGTRASLTGMTDGTVPTGYAEHHHARWDPSTEPVEHRPALTPARFTAAMLIAAAGVALAWLIA